MFAISNKNLILVIFFILTLIFSGIFLLGSLKKVQADITTGLVGYWKFDEGVGTTTADSSGSGVTGTLANGPTWVSGKINGALSFDGVNDYVRIPSSPSWKINGLTQYSISFWVKVKAIGDYKGALAIGPWGGNWFYAYTRSNTWFIEIRTAGGPNGWTCSEPSPALGYLTTLDNSFHHVAIVLDAAASRCDFYSDGNLVHTDGYVDGTTSFGAGDLIIGGYDGSNFLQSEIDEVRIYNRALSASDVSSLYNETPPPPPPPAADTTPPFRSSGSPTGTLAAGTTQTNLSLTTNENATCRYSTTAGTSYASMSSTFSTTGGTSHSTTITGLTDGTSYNYSVRCQDVAGNANTDDFTITFSIAAPRLPPELPRVFLDTTYTLPTGGRTITVNAGGDLQGAINAAVPGDIIELQAGATFTGNFTLPNKSGTGWIYIRSSAHASLPAPGNRVTPAQASLMSKIVSQNSAPALQTAPGAHHFRFIGVEFAVAPGVAINYGIVVFGDGSGAQSSLGQVPHDLILDRSYIHGQPTEDVSRGVALNSASTSIIDSYISEAHGVGFDTQAIAGWNGPGPYKIVNNYLEGAGENVIFGGADPAIPNLVPSDIEIRGNHFFKPLKWKIGDPSYAGIPWTVKNLFELKNAQRVLVDGNIFEQNWAHAQVGFAILFTVRNQDGTAPWSVVEDVTFANNIVRHTSSAVNILAVDGPNISQQVNRLLIQNNLFDDINRTNYGGDGRIFQQVTGSDPALDVKIDHNTAFHVGGGNSFGVAGDCCKVGQNYAFQNNIVTRGDYGFFGGGVGEGTVALNTYFTNWTFQKNAIIGLDVSASYPQNNFFPSSVDSVGFVNHAAGDYHLSALSPYNNAGTDGEDLGADIDALNVATSCAVSGQCAGVTPPPPPPSDTTNPSVPTGLTATPISTSQINLSWTASTDNVGVAGYRIYRSGTQIATVTSGTSYQNTGLTANTAYSYTVAAYDVAGNVSAQSASASATTLAPSETTPPVISSILVSNTTTSTVTITWITDELSTSQVDYGFTTSYGVSTAINSNLVLNHSVNLTNLSSGATYQFRVRSKDASNNEAISTNRSFITTSPILPDVTPPAQITNLAASNVKSNSLDLTWTAVGDDGVVGQAFSYEIKYLTLNITESNWSTAVLLPSLPNPKISGSSDFYTVLSLSANTKYYFAIKAKDAAGNQSILSNVASTTTATASTAPSTTSTGGGSGGGGTSDFKILQISNLKVGEGKSQASFYWTNPTDSMYARTIIVRSAVSPPIKVADGKTIFDGNDIQYTDVNLINGQTYYYALFVVDRFYNISTPINVIAVPNVSVESVSEKKIEIPILEQPKTESKTAEVPNIRYYKKGIKTPEIKLIQSLLIKAGFLNISTSTEYFGPLTEKAIIVFQKKYDLPSTGIIGPITLNKMFEVYQLSLEPFTEKIKTTEVQANVAVIFEANLYLGLKNNNVKSLQEFLISQDFLKERLNTGFFGPLTQKAVIDFQAKHRLPATGFFGPLTRAKIAELTEATTTPVVLPIATTTVATTTSASAVTTPSVTEKAPTIKERIEMLRKRFKSILR